MILGLIVITAWFYLVFFHGGFWRLLPDPVSPEPGLWPSVDIVVPARNEAEMLPRTLPALLGQDYPGRWRIILVDDHSRDGTGDLARNLLNGRDVVLPPELPAGWTGKVAAMNSGVVTGSSDYILFTDADIEHPADSLRRLVARAVETNLDLTSRMVRLQCESIAEMLLIPAFVYFFAMLYPFRRANDPESRVAAAAGGVMLVRRRMLDKIGGLAAIKSALIDDCALAAAVKNSGGRIELTLTDRIKSLRRYPRFADIHKMIARTAYTQLRYSPLLLAGTCLGMFLLFLLPPGLLIGGRLVPAATGITAWLLMSFSYLPLVRFYRQHPVIALTLPLAAAIYTLATIDSARLHWLRKGGQWKGRTQS